MGGGSEYRLTYPASSGETRQWYRFSCKSLNEEWNRFLVLQENISDAITASEEVRESREQVRYRFNELSVASLICDMNGSVLEANAAAAKLLNRSSSEFSGLSLDQVLGKDHDRVNELIKDLEYSHVHQQRATLVRADGEVITAELSMRLYRDKSGDFRMMVMLQDISDKKEVEEELTSEKRFIDVAMDSLPGLFVVLDTKGKILRYNSGFLRDLGYGHFIDHGLLLDDIVASSDQEFIASMINEVLNEGSLETHLQLKRSDGEVRDFDFSARRFEDRGEKFVVATGIDISDVLNTEREKIFNYSLMEQLFDHSPNAIVLVDSENRIEKCNDAFTKLFGYNRDEIRGQDIDQLIISGGDEEIERETGFSNDVLSGHARQRETVRWNKNGDEIPVLLGTVPVTMDREVVAAYGIYVDLSERVELQERVGKLLETEQSVRKELEVLLLEVHHRVKNNLAVIIGLMDLQLMDVEDSELSDRLKEVQSRIYSIARIHESIYQYEDFLRVDFDTYIESMIISWMERPFEQDFEMELEKVVLNVNQAVSLGLLMNEIFNLIHRCKSNECGLTGLTLSESNDVVQISVDSCGFDFTGLTDNGESDIFTMKIIRILLLQLNADHAVSTDHPGKLSISFEKADVKGSISSFY